MEPNVKPDPQVDFYEVLPQMQDEVGEVTLSASFTPNNGIRISLLDTESDDPNWRDFDFDEEQAEIVGQALVRWAQRSRAEREIIRCCRP
jgi:hypothetical protein